MRTRTKSAPPSDRVTVYPAHRSYPGIPDAFHVACTQHPNLGFCGHKQDAEQVRTDRLAAKHPPQPVASLQHDDLRLAWHDVTCPEAGQCRSRDLHARSADVTVDLISVALARLGVIVTGS